MADGRARVALGFSVHTGWAAALAAGGTPRAPVVEERARVELIEGERRFVYHHAAEVPLAQAQRDVARAAEEAKESASRAVARMRDALRAGGHEVVACGVVASAGESGAPLADIVAAHPRIHTHEGYFYRDALVAAAKAHGLAARVLPPKSLDAVAAKALRAST